MHFCSIYSSWQITKTPCWKVKSFGFRKMKYILLLPNVALQTLFGWKSSPLNKNPIRSHIILTITPLIVPFTPIKWVSETQNHREKNTLLCLASSFAHTKTQFCFTYTTMLTGMHTFGYIGLANWLAHYQVAYTLVSRFSRLRFSLVCPINWPTCSLLFSHIWKISIGMCEECEMRLFCLLWYSKGRGTGKTLVFILVDPFP